LTGEIYETSLWVFRGGMWFNVLWQDRGVDPAAAQGVDREAKSTGIQTGN